LNDHLNQVERRMLAALFFLLMMAAGMWHVPLSRILSANGFATLLPYAYATTAVAAFVSPLIFGAMADRHASPVVVLRWLSAASAAAMIMAGISIASHAPAAVVLGLIQLYSLAAVPTLSISSTIIFSRLQNSQQQFGPIRAMGTFGWMCGCWFVSGLGMDAAPSALYVGALVWIALWVFTWLVPSVAPPAAPPATFLQRLGWDALGLLKNHDHRVVFLTLMLFSIPLAAFYPFTPVQLRQLGFERTAAWMSTGQITEIIGMLCLARLFATLRLKWIFVAGLFVGVLRYALCAFDSRPSLLAGVALHGFSFTLVYVTAQIYLNERIESAWRARAQALMSLLSSGVGNLAGYLATGAWFSVCSEAGATRWTLFWSWLATAVAGVLVFFLYAYHGRSPGFRKSQE
jgi:hypothetical protein